MNQLTFRRVMRIQYPDYDQLSRTIKLIDVFELREWDMEKGVSANPVVSVVKREYDKGDSDVTLVANDQMKALIDALEPFISNGPIDSFVPIPLKRQ